MKRFHFTLEAVGTVRRRQEQKAMEKYAQCLVVHHQAVEALDQVGREITGSCQEWRVKLAAGYAAAQAAQFHGYQRLLLQRQHECIQAVETAQRRVNAAMQSMLLARRRREIVDKYYDKQLARFQRDYARSEQKVLDDLAGRRRNSIFAWKPAETSL